MRSYSAVYVDAGYLIAAAATRVTGTSLRSGVTVDHRTLIEALIAQAEQASGLPALRVNWYDSAPRGVPDEEQRRIALLARVKVRLGRLSYSGEQKGVDLRIGLDLSTQGRRRVVDVAYLVSGDDDLTEAVEEAQSHGVQVIVLAVRGADGRPHGVAQHLISEADELVLIDDDIITAAVRAVRTVPAPAAPPPEVTAPPAAEPSRPAEPVPTVEPYRIPSPAELAKRPGTVTQGAVAAAPAPVPARSSLAYSTSTGQGGHEGVGALDAVTADLIDQVCRGVVTTWARTVDRGEWERMIKSRPSIPSDLDRALLVDMSDRTGSYDLDEVTRHELRARFWEVVEVGVQP